MDSNCTSIYILYSLLLLCNSLFVLCQKLGTFGDEDVTVCAELANSLILGLAVAEALLIVDTILKSEKKMTGIVLHFAELDEKIDNHNYVCYSQRPLSLA